MTDKQYYIEEIRRNRAEIAELTAERTEHWNTNRRDLYKLTTAKIRELNVRIKDLMEIYEISEDEI